MIILLIIFITMAISISTGLTVHHYTSYFPRKLSIPKNIYTVWHTKDIPQGMKENMESVKRDNPDFEHCFFDDNDCENFIKDNFSEEIFTAYNNLIPSAYKSDLWRYCIMYINGGIYMDLKFKCVDGFNFSMLLDNEYFVKEYANEGFLDITKVFNGFMVCAPNSDCLKTCIYKIVNNVKNKYYGITPLDPTGPRLLGSQFSCFEIPKFELCYLIPKSGDRKGKQIIKFGDRVILEQYTNYRKDQIECASKTHKQKYYTEYWKTRQMYI